MISQLKLELSIQKKLSEEYKHKYQIAKLTYDQQIRQLHYDIKQERSP